jgi:serine/threonine protein kinase
MTSATKKFTLEKLNSTFENRQSSNLSRSNFEFLKIIGSGGFGKVYQVVSLYSKNHYAMKIISKRQVEGYEMLSQLQKEIEIMDKCRHPSIIDLKACFEDSK